MKTKHPMTSGQWLVAFAATVLALALLLMGFNYLTDPFGAFGDRVMQWWSYDETMNPRVAKISYLEQHHENYDSYIVGCSSSSSWPVEEFNELYDASFYNMIMYGADMLDVELTCRYLADHYEVKNLVVSIYIHNAEIYDTETHPLTRNLHHKVDGSSALAYYGKYLFANPEYGMAKLRAWQTDGYVQRAHDVFNEQTGAYDKSRRDVEPIGDLEAYLSKDAYKGFRNYPMENGSIGYLEECMGSMERIVALCAERGINLVVVTPPMYHENFNYYSTEEVAAFSRALAEVTDYWDFTLSSVSFDPRYFYDETHFRNCVGQMAAAKIAGEEDWYVPEDFGCYVTRDNVDAVLEAYAAASPAREETYTCQIPIILYHHIAQEPANIYTMGAEMFEQHMQALAQAGYTAVSFEDLRAYVEQGTELPEKPIVITFDDGYESNLLLAGPVLREYGMEATVFTIGVSDGKATYKDTDHPITPHFSLGQALEYSDVFRIGSHGYDIHQVEGLDPDPIREGILMRPEETEEEYIRFLREDCAAVERLFLDAYGTGVSAFAYPHGLYSELSEIILNEEGFDITLTTQKRINTIIKGIPQSLRQMGRFDIAGDVTAEQLLELLG